MAARYDQNTAPPRHPEKGSLYDIFLERDCTSLLVSPLEWTEDHAQFLRAKWEKLADCDQPTPNLPPGSQPSSGHTNPSPTIVQLGEALTTITIPNLLWPEVFGEACSKPQFLPRFHLGFGGRVYSNVVKAQVLWNFPSGETGSLRSSPSTRLAETSDTPTVPANPPMLCYIDKDWIAAKRGGISTVRVKRDNEPVLNARLLENKKLQPSDASRDAYLVGVFLGMAERYFDSLSPPDNKLKRHELPPPDSQDIKLRILMHDAETATFIVYSTEVMRVFLEMFHDPFKAPPSSNNASAIQPKIKYTRVPFWPILGLRERLGKALGQDGVGPFNPEELETFMREPDSRKRTLDPGDSEVPAAKRPR
ncbi:hypothetical protein FDECE_18521 [Fusarium decemcellulare]|nr:hypothetical protein FDECE_18521 [Fusarium decemcellulare]